MKNIAVASSWTWVFMQTQGRDECMLYLRGLCWKECKAGTAQPASVSGRDLGLCHSTVNLSVQGTGKSPQVSRSGGIYVRLLPTRRSDPDPANHIILTSRPQMLIEAEIMPKACPLNNGIFRITGTEEHLPAKLLAPISNCT